MLLLCVFVLLSSSEASTFIFFIPPLFVSNLSTCLFLLSIFLLFIFGIFTTFPFVASDISIFLPLLSFVFPLPVP